MVAFAILAVVLTSVLVLFQQTLNLQTSVKNRVVALYLAQEGLEGIRQIRDSNWLEFSGDKRHHWLEGINNADAYYEFDYDLDTQKYTAVLSSIQTPLLFTATDFAANTSNYAPFQLYKASDLDEGLFTLNPQDSGGDDNTRTPFYRQIQIQVHNPYEALVDNGTLGNLPGFCDGDDDTCNAAQITVTARVGWESGDNNMEQVLLETQLFDYLGRNEY
ncbi:MAG TPA: hypothetical protein VIT68_00050 [Candidatus Gracilibacteria bacterium]